MGCNVIHRQAGLLMIVLAALLIGCGPTRTAGTKGLAAKELAVLKISQHNAIPGFHINAVTIDDDQKFEISKTREFYLTPGEHKIAVGYGRCVHGPPAWFSPMEDFTLFAPTGGTTMNVEAGKRYELEGWSKGLGSLLQYLHKVVEAAESEE